MTKHIWTVVCKESKIDHDTNNITLIDSYENLQFDLNTTKELNDRTKPIVGPFGFEVVSLFYRDKKGTYEEFEVIAKILDPKGTTLGEFPSKAEFKESHNRVRNRIKFNTIALTASGVYIVQVSFKRGNKYEQVAAIPLDIQVKLDGKEL